MSVTVDPSTGVRVQVWRDGQLFCAMRADTAGLPEICLGIDLFEVIAELGGLDLERPAEAEEANRLAQEAQQRLAAAAPSERPGELEPTDSREEAT